MINLTQVGEVMQVRQAQQREPMLTWFESSGAVWEAQADQSKYAIQIIERQYVVYREKEMGDRIACIQLGLCESLEEAKAIAEVSAYKEIPYGKRTNL